MICARSTLVWRWQDGALWIDRHGVYSWTRLRPRDLQRETVVYTKNFDRWCPNCFLCLPHSTNTIYSYRFTLLCCNASCCPPKNVFFARPQRFLAPFLLKNVSGYAPCSKSILSQDYLSLTRGVSRLVTVIANIVHSDIDNI